MKASIPHLCPRSALFGRPDGFPFSVAHWRTWLLAGWVLVWGGVVCAEAAAGVDAAERFEKHIRPVLADQCYDCHSTGSSKLKAGLRLDSRAGLLQGGDTGPALVPGKPEESLLFRVISHLEKDMAMPPKKPKLSASVLGHFEAWIREGAVWPGEQSNTVTAIKAEFDLRERKERLPWLWLPVSKPSVPEVARGRWSSNPVDRFVLDRLTREGLKPSEPTAPHFWLRRVHFALTGLPPSPADLQQFLDDRSENARARVVDRLLSSPQFGERWGRHWLDLMRYAESRGHESDFIIPNAYEYRDYVIRAFNLDLPYNQFVTEHLAGDLLSRPRVHPEKGFNESVLGTGWAFLGEEIHAPVDTRQDEMDRIDNRIDVMTKSFLGVTVSCARCHDHKFDAISQKDYYALAGYFVSTGQRLARFESMEQEREAARHLAVWRTEQETVLRRAWAEVVTPLLGRSADYLEAAAAVWNEDSSTNRLDVGIQKQGTTFVLSSAVQEKVARRAQAVGKMPLDPAVLTQWTLALGQASKNDQDPLHSFAVLSLRGVSPARVTSSSSAGPFELSLPEGAEVRHRFDALSRAFQQADGFAFGLRPVQAGELRLTPGLTNRDPLFRVQTMEGAATDPEWSRMGLAAGVEREPSLFGSWPKEGATIRSPKFELKTGKLHYLVRGGGRVFAAVDSQRLVTGPLHTGLLKDWGHRDDWHWISHDLTAYAGHRVSIEFSPGQDFDTAVACVVESEQVPVQPVTAAGWMARALEGKENQVESRGAAVRVQERLLEAIRRFEQGTTSVADLQLTHWMGGRPELFSGVSGRWPSALAPALKQYEEGRDRCIAHVPWKSRTAPAMLEGNGVDEYLLVRGKHFTPKGKVPRRFLEAAEASIAESSLEQQSGRAELARTLTDPQNPLLARVYVNRLWYQLFGRGLVPTVDNFGWLGQRPSHPELLDYLAFVFVHEDEWSTKRFLRRLLLTETYAQSSAPGDARTEEKDPENALLHRMNLKRLEGEAIRDSILAMSGRLDLKQGGPSVPLHESQFTEARGLRSERGPLDGDGRRSIYVAARRNFLPMMMTAFDLPTPFTTTGRRNVSNVPGQMLFLMNDPFVHQQARVCAERILREMPGASAEERIQRLYRTAFARPATELDLQRCRQLLQESGALVGGGTDSVDAWAELCHALIGVKEFIFVR